MQEMKYFNEGNDCDICKNQLMTGRDGTVEDCRRRQNGLSCRFEERDIRTCPVYLQRVKPYVNVKKLKKIVSKHSKRKEREKHERMERSVRNGGRTAGGVRHKEYKTIEGALKAAAKNEELVVWDENGNVIGSLTDNVPEGALETNPDGSVNTYNADGNKVGTMTAEELKAATTLTDEKDAEGQQGNAGASTDDENGGTGGNTPVEPENGQNGANSEQENGQQTYGDGDDAAGQETSGDDERKTEEQVSDSDTIYPEKTTRAIVDCDGALNLRRSASWGNESICGRAVRGQSYYIKAIHTVEGKKMLETIDGIFLSGQPEHVRIIEV